MIARLRVVTLNIHKGLSQFNRRVVIHDLREGLRALDPDLVFLQEVQGLNDRHALRFASWPGEPQHEFLAGARWQSAYGRNRVYEHGHHGNALLSRFPIVAVENQDVSAHRFERRGLLHAVVRVPGARRAAALRVRAPVAARARPPAAAGGDRRAARLGRARRRADHRRRRFQRLAPARDARARVPALGLTEVSFAARGRHARTFPSLLPLLRLDRIYVRGFDVLGSRVLRGAPWSLLSDHLAVSAELRLAPGARGA
ncbi:MAG: endonuclease/exonuclease/phosphatase family protein [Burkholderiales bacterium]|nr:endonuclease/exonuclease/phosphatase family protein [Burkholderiales bacterium]